MKNKEAVINDASHAGFRYKFIVRMKAKGLINYIKIYKCQTPDILIHIFFSNNFIFA